jgi:broad specificity phosphatase PhoE
MTGSTDLPLNALGRQQAELIASRLASEPSVPVIYSSPLVRAFDTALAIGLRRNAAVIPTDGLREIDCGIVDGMPLGEVETRYPAEWAENLRQDDPLFRWPGGESYLDFRARCLRAIRSIADRHPGATVILVTHAGVISQVIGYLRGDPPSRWEQHRPGNASLTRIRWNGRTIRVTCFDDRDHLREARREVRVCSPRQLCE